MLNEVAITAPPTPAEQTAFVLAQALWRDGVTLAQACGISGEELEAAYAMAYGLYGQGCWDDALQLFDFLCQHSHLERRFHVGRGSCLHMLRQYERALVAYGVAHVMDVEEPSVALRTAECLIALGRHSDALTALETVELLVTGKPEHAALQQRAQALAELLTHTEGKI